MNKLFKIFKDGETPRKYAAVGAAVLVLCLILELFVFNFRWVQSWGYESYNISEVKLVSGAEKMDDGKYKQTADKAVFNLGEVNRKINNIHIYAGGNEGKAVGVGVVLTDEANEYEYSIGEHKVCTGVARSQYLSIHASGEVKNLQIEIKGEKNKEFYLSDIKLNQNVPLFFSFGRLITLAVLIMLIYLIRPKSFVYEYKMDIKSIWQKGIIILLIIVQAVLFWRTVNFNPYFQQPEKRNYFHAQYQDLTHAIVEGKLYLDYEPSEKLVQMENPYDTTARSREKVQYRWDHAYYNGKYYVYFGVGPVLLFYLPYYLITGADLPTYVAVFISAILLMLAILMLLWQLMRRYFQNTPFALYMILAAVFINTCGAVYILKRPDFYSLPIITAMAFAIAAVAFWIWALRGADYGERGISVWKIALGSVFAAMTAICRPQFLLVIGFGIVLMWNYVFKKRKLFSKTGFMQTLALCLPFALIGAFAMWYNYARFGSVFDFGANYNLTTNDMTHRGWIWGRTPLGIFMYLLQPVRLKAIFPFIDQIGISTEYLGRTISETMYGGALWINPLLWTGLLCLPLRKKFKNRESFHVALFALIAAIIIVVVNTQMAGILYRYLSDFTWLLLIAAVIAICMIYERIKNSEIKKWFMCGVIILAAAGLAAHYMGIFVDVGITMENDSPFNFYNLKHLIAFWL